AASPPKSRTPCCSRVLSDSARYYQYRRAFENRNTCSYLVDSRSVTDSGIAFGLDQMMSLRSAPDLASGGLGVVCGDGFHGYPRTGQSATMRISSAISRLRRI